MKKMIAALMSLLISLGPFSAVPARANMVKSGVLSTDEVWSGTVEVEGNITVPKGRELVIKPGTRLVYDQAGTANKAPEIVVYGTLKVGDDVLNGSQYVLLPGNRNAQTIRITPYEVDTKILRDEFNAFRVQYAIIWTLLGGALIYAVSHR